MQIQLRAPKIWMANESVDFRKAINGLSELVVNHFNHRLENNVYIFHNRARNKLKLLAYHRNGAILIYKCLDKKKFTLKEDTLGLYKIDEKQLSWLLAGLDWVEMSSLGAPNYDDYF